jgi:hypothetical protein
MFRVISLILIASAGCSRPPRHAGLPAPDPGGCYVIVYEQPEFRGIRDVLNGPGRWPVLEELRQTNERSWQNRIRSLRIGKTATVTVYTDSDYTGDSKQFDPSSEHPRLERTISGQIESLQIRCRRADGDITMLR